MRFAQATALAVISCWVSISPPPALAHGLVSLVVAITSPASGFTGSPEQVTWLLGWAATHESGSERLNSRSAL